MRWRRGGNQPAVVATKLSVTWTDCCGYVPNNEGVGAPVYVLVGDEHLAHIENPTIEHHAESETP